jgi:type IV secretory pathway VirB3-like protein
MIYVLAALLPPIGLLLNGQPFSAIFNLVLIVFCVVFGLVFHILLLVPSAHAVIAVHMKREQRMHREVVDASAGTVRRPATRAEREAAKKPVHGCQTL